MAVKFFNEAWYLARNPDVKQVVDSGQMTAEQHFELYGAAEGRSPSPLFDTAYYLQKNPDVAEALEGTDITPYAHFEAYGHAEGRLASPYFNPDQYLEANPDLEGMEASAYEHFQAYGMDEGRSPLTSFNLDHYLLANPDVAEAIGDNKAAGVHHFLNYGVNEDRSLNAVVSVAAYLAANLDVLEAVEAGQTTGLAHLLTYGIAEGRDLGNGVSAEQFVNDPVYQEAIEAGDLDAALSRMAEVAPFLPEFEAPEGFELPADWPIPQDFVPAEEGTKLTLPEGWIPAEPVQLPDAFEQPFTVEVTGGVVHFPDASGEIRLVNVEGSGAFAQNNILGDVRVSLNGTATIEVAAGQTLVGAHADVSQLNVIGEGAVTALGTEEADDIDATGWNLTHLTVDAGAGDDRVTIGDGQSAMGGEGADTFVISATAGTASVVTVDDYSFEQGDVVDLSEVEGLNPFAMEIRGAEHTDEGWDWDGYDGDSIGIWFTGEVANVQLTDARHDTIKFLLPEVEGFEDYTTLQVNIAEGGILRAGDDAPDALFGGDGSQVLVSGTQADLMAGGGGSDTFVIRDAAQSNLENMDRIFDFTVGEDFLVSHTYIGAGTIANVGPLEDLEAETLGEALTADTFAANAGAFFTVGEGDATQSFLVLNDGTAGFDAATDTVIEITGYSGDLGSLSVIGVPDLGGILGNPIEEVLGA